MRGGARLRLRPRARRPTQRVNLRSAGDGLMVLGRCSPRLWSWAGFAFVLGAVLPVEAEEQASYPQAAPAEVVVSASRPALAHSLVEPTLASTVLSGEVLHRAGQSTG